MKNSQEIAEEKSNRQMLTSRQIKKSIKETKNNKSSKKE